jgi:plasmid stabilization system protein ParE
MAAEIALLPAARSDLADACAWYDQRGEGLGDRFLDAVDECLGGLMLHAESREVARQSKIRTYRRAVVSKFPYAIFYAFERDIVFVFAVLHTSRDPRKWRRRLP